MNKIIINDIDEDIYDYPEFIKLIPECKDLYPEYLKLDKEYEKAYKYFNYLYNHQSFYEKVYLDYKLYFYNLVEEFSNKGDMLRTIINKNNDKFELWKNVNNKKLI